MRRPLVFFSILFSLGIAIARFTPISFNLVYLLAAILLVFSLFSWKKNLIFHLALASLVFILGIAALKNSQILCSRHILRLVPYKNNNSFIIRGIIVNQPILKNKRTIFIFKAKEIQSSESNRKCCGYILTYIKDKRNFSYGEELILRGNLSRVFSPRYFSHKSYQDYLAHQGIYCILRVKAAHDILRLNKNRGFILKECALWLKSEMEKIIFTHVSSVAAGIIDAMVLGEKRNIPPLITSAMIKSGTVHILVVSGFNVGIVAFMIILFLKLMRLKRRVSFSIAIFLLIIYCLLTGASTPVVRATVMAIIFMLAYLVKRDPDIYNSLSIAAIFILSINPRQLFDLGFQLSFLSVISIVYLYPKIRSFLHIDSLKIKYLRFLIDGSLVSFSAWLGTMGPIAYYFKIFSPITVLANLCIVPLASLITLSGFSLVIVSLVCPALAKLFAYSSELFVFLLLHINALLIKIPGASCVFS